MTPFYIDHSGRGFDLTGRPMTDDERRLALKEVADSILPPIDHSFRCSPRPVHPHPETKGEAY